MKKALFQETGANSAVRCGLCRHRCLIPEGKRGICGVRENRGGELYSLVYGRAVAVAVDPIEKKPLYHFLPGSESFSIATKGCNFGCLHCQNWHIARPGSEDIAGRDTRLEPADVVRLAESRKCASISYTYTEPTVFFEYAYDTARLASDKGLKNVFVTNGYITPEALETISPYLDAANIDLKAFRDKTYRKLTGARLQPVLDMIDMYHRLGIWIEVTTLVIPGWNDSTEELGDIAKFIAGVSPDIPWHVSRFSPAHKLMDAPPTPVKTIEDAVEIGREAGLKYVYQGNVFSPAAARTLCPGCGECLIDRSRSGPFLIRNGRLTCPKCGIDVPGVWE
ncbi:MAG: AmmeMemoRadiSam system radical SAM enzyme [Kiritimatiellia bacterium]